MAEPEYVLNELNLPIGVPLAGWTPPSRPPRDPMVGQFCRVEPLDLDRHSTDLYAANLTDTENRIWVYLAYGPFDSLDSYLTLMRKVSSGDDPFFHAIIDLKTEKAVGVASYLRIDPIAGSIEVGHINYSPLLQRSPAATEAMYLMMKRAFDLGYRRYEWKCDALNGRSRAAAQRYGLSYEGIFRQATNYKGRNRDTAWYAAIDKDWPSIRAAFETWLDPANFDSDGEQYIRLADLTRPLLSMKG